MKNIFESWMEELPQQFKGKKNIETIIRAFSRQIEELYQVFSDLDTKTDLDTAVGINLDYVGTIIPLTRKEAGVLAGKNIAKPVISDERYRHFLRYRSLINTSACTYKEIVESVSMLWDIDNFRYIEDPKYPATIKIEVPLDIDGTDPRIGNAVAVKPAGVMFYYEVNCSEGYYIVEVKTNSALTLLSSFYPRYNVPDLYNNGYAIMDGTYYMNGFQSDQLKDFYPMSLMLQSENDAQPFIRNELIAKSDVEHKKAEYNTAVKLNSFINAKSGYDNVINISSAASTHVSIGKSHLTVEKSLGYNDGEYYMDGSRCMDAEIYEYDL